MFNWFSINLVTLLPLFPQAVFDEWNVASNHKGDTQMSVCPQIWIVLLQMYMSLYICTPKTQGKGKNICWAFIWLVSWKIPVSQKLTLHLSSLTNIVKEAKGKSWRTDYFCDLHLTFSVHGQNKLCMEFIPDIENYTRGMGKRAYQFQLLQRSRRGEWRASHPRCSACILPVGWRSIKRDVRHASGTKPSPLHNSGVQALLTLNPQGHWTNRFYLET